MSYAQTNYPQIQGINGRYTIHDIGCLLTSFCNLEEEYGKVIDPLTLNNFFRDRNLYIDVDDGIRDDLDWGFVQLWDRDTRVIRVGYTGWPDSNNAIVKFAYTSTRTGRPTTHFCKVVDYVNHIILDSWDGVVKHVSGTVYGQPVAWATYEHVVPAPVAPPVLSAPPYWTEPITPKQVITNLNPTRKWGLNYDNQQAMEAHPIAEVPGGTILTVVARVHHNNHETYYKTDMADPDGYNVNDCPDYIAPVIIPPKPPAPPVVVKPVEKYTLIKNMMFFNNALDAKNKANYAGDLLAGEYIVWSKEDNSYNLTDDNRYNQNKWVNINDNKPDVVTASVVTLPVDAPAPDITIPVDVSDNSIPIPELEHLPPEAPKPQYGWIRDDKLPVRLMSTNSLPVPIHDLEGKYPVQQFPAHRIEDYSMFAVVNNIEYWLPDRTRNKGWMYGVDVAFLPEDPEPTMFDRNHNGRYDIIDIFDNGLQGFIETSSKYFDGIKKAVSTVAPKIEPAKQRVVKTIDGFSARRKDK